MDPWSDASETPGSACVAALGQRLTTSTRKQIGLSTFRFCETLTRPSAFVLKPTEASAKVFSKGCWALPGSELPDLGMHRERVLVPFFDKPFRV